MNCNEIENMLPAYLEGSPEEREDIAGHLASCPRCSRILKDLKAAEQIVRGIEEVEPPPFFEQRIMARIREEAERKEQGILRRLFYPLHIKVPIQALATILIAVFAFHLYQAGDPELKRIAPLPVPVAEPEKEKSLERMPARGFIEKDRQQSAAPPVERGAKEESMADSRVPIREERSAAVEKAAPVTAASEKQVIPAGAETLRQSREGIGSADQAHERFSSQQQRKAKTADAGAAAGESRKGISAPAAPQMAAMEAIKRPIMDLTIQVRDTTAAIREIETRLDQVSARIIERRRLGGSEFLKIEIAARNITAFQELLKSIGEVNLESQSSAVPDENLTVTIKIVEHE